MSTTPWGAAPELVSIIGGQAKTTSLLVAEKFGKRHDTVLRAIRRLDCSPEFTERNFAVSAYSDSTGRQLPYFEMTRDGFTFLAMSFTGKIAAQWKEHYLHAFNAMEATLQAPQKPDILEQARAVLFSLRFLVCFERDGTLSVQEVPKGAVVADGGELPCLLTDPGGPFTKAMMPSIINAATQRLKGVRS